MWKENLGLLVLFVLVDTSCLIKKDYERKMILQMVVSIQTKGV